MIERTATIDGEQRRALYSDDEFATYRYLLAVTWDPSLPTVYFVGLNPSKATELKNDPTITRECGFARSWGFGGLLKTNIAAYRSKDPRGMLRQFDPIGPENTPEWIAAQPCDLVVGCWGQWASHAKLSAQARAVRRAIGDRLHALTLTSDGWPGHALYLRATLRPMPIAKLEALRA